MVIAFIGTVYSSVAMVEVDITGTISQWRQSLLAMFTVVFPMVITGTEVNTTVNVCSSVPTVEVVIMPRYTVLSPRWRWTLLVLYTVVFSC